MKWTRSPRGINKVNRLLALNLRRNACDDLLYIEDDMENFDIGPSETRLAY